jgi:hypothetical protein
MWELEKEAVLFLGKRLAGKNPSSQGTSEQMEAAGL